MKTFKQLSFVLAFVLALLLVMAGAQASTLLVDDQFARTAGPGSGANSTAVGVPVPTGAGAWIDHVGNGWSSGGGKLTGVAAAGGLGANYLYRPASDACADHKIVADTDFITGPMNIGLIVRLNASASSLNGYFLGVTSNALQMYTMVNGSGTALGSAFTISAVAGHKYEYTLSAVGSTISCTVFDLGTAGTPANTQLGSTITATDTTYPGTSATTTGLGLFNVDAVYTRALVTSLGSSVPLLAVSPTTGFTGAAQTETATGTGTAWTSGTTFSVSGGTGASISGTVVNVGAQTATFTLNPGTAAGTLTIGNNTDAGTAAMTISAASTSSPTGGTYLFSPYNWLLSGGVAKTINSGAYFRTYITGTVTCKINLSVGSASPFSQCWARIDGQPWQKYVPTAAGAQTWTLTIPSPNNSLKHLLEFVVKSSSQGGDRWGTQTTAITLLGLVLDSGGGTTLPPARKYRILLYGTSISEGVLVNGNAGGYLETDYYDALGDYALRVGELLDAEIGVVGFGAQGLLQAGNGNVPVLTSSWNFLWSGQARTFSPVPDLVIYEEGTNDSAATLANLQAAYNTVVNGIGFASGTATFSGLQGTRHLLLRPLNGSQAANISSIASSYGSSNVVYGDTTGLWTTADSIDSLHPFAYIHLGSIAPGVAALAMPLLHPATSGAASTIRRRIQ